MYRVIFVLIFSLFFIQVNAQLTLIKGDSTSTINVYGNEKLKIIEKKYTSSKNGKSKVKLAPTKGYRIQVYNGADRVLANNIKKGIVQRLPEHRSYLLFAHPNYRIRVGDFKDRDEATQLYKYLKTLYPNSIIVNDVINAK